MENSKHFEKWLNREKQQNPHNNGNQAVVVKHNSEELKQNVSSSKEPSSGSHCNASFQYF